MKRERAYDRVVAADVHHAALDKARDIQLYTIPDGKHGRPDRLHPVLLSYIDVVVEGYLNEFGEDGVARFFASTGGWDAPIADDRAAPRYSPAPPRGDRQVQAVGRRRTCGLRGRTFCRPMRFCATERTAHRPRCISWNIRVCNANGSTRRPSPRSITRSARTAAPRRPNTSPPKAWPIRTPGAHPRNALKASTGRIVPDRVASPVDPRRIERVAEIVERGVRRKEHPVEKERQRQRPAKQEHKIAGDAGCIEKIDDRVSEAQTERERSEPQPGP